MMVWPDEHGNGHLAALLHLDRGPCVCTEAAHAIVFDPDPVSRERALCDLAVLWPIEALRAALEHDLTTLSAEGS